MMWTEYSREKPARPRWTLVTMGLAFIATVIGAKVMVDSGGSAVSGWQELDGWPIVFELPADYRWGCERGIGRTGAQAGGDRGVAQFRGQDASGNQVILRIEFNRLPRAGKLRDALEEMTGMVSGWDSQMTIGPFEGVVSVSDESGYGMDITAAGFDGEGLGIVIVLRSGRALSAAMQTFRSLCESIEHR